MLEALDAPTLLQVNAVFSGFAALGWVLLAGLFRIAPGASWLMAAAHLCCVAALQCSDCAAGPLAALAELATLATLALLALAVRRMLRLRWHWQDIGAITAAGLLGGLLLGMGVAQQGGLIAVSASIAVLALLAGRDIVSGAGPGLAPGFLPAMVLPYLAAALLSGGRAVALGWAPGLDEPFVEGRHASALMAGLWLLLSMAISLSLVALLVWRLISRIEHLTRRDAMTDTLNRRALASEMRGLQGLLERGHAYAIVVVDIDHFKRINDELGHAGGDAALLHAVALLRGCLREQDLLGRLGGEEFCVLLPHTPLAAASGVAERMRAALQQAPLLWRGRKVVLRASFGVAAGQPDDPLGEVGLNLADQQVYRAKAEGRNRVCVAQESGP